jgi:hypothetical protein
MKKKKRGRGGGRFQTVGEGEKFWLKSKFWRKKKEERTESWLGRK